MRKIFILAGTIFFAKMGQFVNFAKLSIVISIQIGNQNAIIRKLFRGGKRMFREIEGHRLELKTNCEN